MSFSVGWLNTGVFKLGQLSPWHPPLQVADVGRLRSPRNSEFGGYH